MRIGHGYDVHQLVENRALYLGGLKIEHTRGLLGHSDADVCLHALMDAMLGALCLGDIGKHFSDQDQRFKDIDSKLLLHQVYALMVQKNYSIGNVDITIIAQRPKIAPYITEMRQIIASILQCDIDVINIKATTEEKLGFTGQELGIACHAVCLLTTV
jgi:2-C-methyl-D-erythritol 2,4-cyclodiphosphate synthase